MASATLDLFGPINIPHQEEWTDSAVFLAKLAALPRVQSLWIRLDSPGGEGAGAWRIYKALREHPAHVIVDILGLCGSAAALVAMAADEIGICFSGAIGLHDPHSNGPKRREVAAAIIAREVARRCRRPPEVVREWMRRQTMFFDDEAVKFGLADRLNPWPGRRAVNRYLGWSKISGG